jgi:hypothetical protein
VCEDGNVYEAEMIELSQMLDLTSSHSSSHAIGQWSMSKIIEQTMNGTDTKTKKSQNHIWPSIVAAFNSVPTT